MRNRTSHAHVRCLAAVCVLALASGCVREQASGEALTYNYRWWTSLFTALPLILAGLVFYRHPSTWFNGVWRPWWSPRGWNYMDAIRVVGLTVLGVMSPLMLCNRLEVGRDYVEESNWMGLRPTRRIEFSQLSRIDLKSEAPAGAWTPDKDREHKKKPDMLAVLRDGSVEEFRGWLVNAARPELLARAQAAGVNVLTTDDPGSAPGIPLMPPPMQRPFGIPLRFPRGDR